MRAFDPFLPAATVGSGRPNFRRLGGDGGLANYSPIPEIEMSRRSKERGARVVEKTDADAFRFSRRYLLAVENQSAIRCRIARHLKLARASKSFACNRLATTASVCPVESHLDHEMRFEGGHWISLAADHRRIEGRKSTLC
jgi:hypothetical protein